MKKRLTCLAALGATAWIFSGCANTGAFQADHRTNVELSSPNYQIVATNVSGSSKSGYVIGLSASMGGQAASFALFRVTGSGNLYQEALENLWRAYEKTNGSVEGKKLALVNVRYDSDLLNFLFYTQIVVTVRADIVEFL